MWWLLVPAALVVLALYRRVAAYDRAQEEIHTRRQEWRTP